LGIQPAGQTLQSAEVKLPEALGWIYVSEGSTLGAAFLFKQAQNAESTDIRYNLLLLVER